MANLLARRNDVRCAVMASAPLDMAAFHRGRDGAVPDHYAMRGDMADPMRTVSAIRPGAAVFVLGDRYDRSVPASAWEAWAADARRVGLRVHTAEIHGFDRPELGGVPPIALVHCGTVLPAIRDRDLAAFDLEDAAGHIARFGRSQPDHRGSQGPRAR